MAPKGLDELEMSSSSSDEDDEKKSDDETKKEENAKAKKNESDKDSSSEGSDIDSEVEKEGKKIFLQKQKTPKKKGGSRSGSRPSTPVDMMMGTGSKLKEVAKKLEGSQSQGERSSPLLGKRSAPNDSNDCMNKRSKVNSGPSGSGTNTPTKDLVQQGVTEEAVRRYLMHKPITSKDLLKKFKTKKTGLSSKEIGMALVDILKRLNPQQKKVNNKLHFYLKP